MNSNVPQWDCVAPSQLSIDTHMAKRSIVLYLLYLYQPFVSTSTASRHNDVQKLLTIEL